MTVRDARGDDCERFVLDGLGERPRTVFSNQMALVGPPADPAKVRGLMDAAEAFARITWEAPALGDSTNYAVVVRAVETSPSGVKTRVIWRPARRRSRLVDQGWGRRQFELSARAGAPDHLALTTRRRFGARADSYAATISAGYSGERRSRDGAAAALLIEASKPAQVPNAASATAKTAYPMSFTDLHSSCSTYGGEATPTRKPEKLNYLAIMQ